MAGSFESDQRHRSIDGVPLTSTDHTSTSEQCSTARVAQISAAAEHGFARVQASIDMFREVRAAAATAVHNHSKAFSLLLLPLLLLLQLLLLLLLQSRSKPYKQV